MKQINLREFYPDYYTEDFYIEVKDEVLETFVEFERAELATKRQKYRYNVHISMDNMSFVSNQLMTPSVEDEYVNQLETECLYNLLHDAIDILPETQARRIKYRFYEGKTLEEIAAIEGTCRSNVHKSIQCALHQLKKILKQHEMRHNK